MTLKVNEIRVGNKVKYSDTDTVFEVTDINSTDSIGIGVKNDDEQTWIELDQFEPIELTAEILKKLGLKQNLTKNAWWDSEESILISESRDKGETKYHLATWGGGPYEPEIEIIGKEIKYLHNFQNLYFALTGEELKINL